MLGINTFVCRPYIYIYGYTYVHIYIYTYTYYIYIYMRTYIYIYTHSFVVMIVTIGILTLYHILYIYIVCDLCREVFFTKTFSSVSPQMRTSLKRGPPLISASTSLGESGNRLKWFPIWRISPLSN